MKMKRDSVLTRRAGTAMVASAGTRSRIDDAVKSGTDAALDELD